MILILNCGSQSIKWKLFSDDLCVKKEGMVRLEQKGYEKALIAELAKVRKFDVSLVGHRFVHGGSLFQKPTIITKQNLKKLESLNKLAPLHNPYNILGIKFSQSVFPKAKQVAVFDTEFFINLPPKAFTYALPEKIVKKYGIRRFGFHGISHEYALTQAETILQRPLENVITCHLGGGSSICAIKKRVAVDTSMGFTPLDGLVMMTRAGSLDPGIVLFLAGKISDIEGVLNHESGLMGICNMSDMRKIVSAKSQKAKLALDVYVYAIQKYIGAYFGILGGCDALVFTGAIGAGSAFIVNMICKDLSILKNTKVLSVKPDEELALAKKISYGR
ncbi:acetate/propionate family kinase [Patescibacteria group bacterium]|nr:acetate/propionate family kinase [Patescibacteria group bacterium]